MDTILEMSGIQKAFGPVKALNNVNLRVKKGEIHAICGENGAGKSTLMKILSGVYAHGSYAGTVLYDGEERIFSGITDSEAVGIIIIHQELALVPMLSITENIFLGNEQSRRGVIDWQASRARAKTLLEKVGLSDSPDTPVGTLGIGKQQLVEIAKALSKEVRLLILDEPTASLNEKDSDTLLELLLDLKKRGVTSIIISHKLNEISRVADSITVIRDGSTVDELDCRNESVSEDRIIKAMVGREMSDRYPTRTPNIGDVIFEVKDWRVQHPTQRDRAVIKGVNLKARAGEIVGIAGLMGSGRTELAMSVFGGTYGQDISGTVFIHGKPVDVSSVQKAINAGLAYVTEDRKGNGLLLDDDIRTNISLANLRGVSKYGVVNEHEEVSVAADFLKKLRIRAQGVSHVVGNLSGGNQQKVVLSKWLFSEPDVLILDEPTRGIDVGAKYEIYSIINQAVAAGKCVVMISSEMPELLGMCDRVYVMNEGRFVGEFTSEEVSQEKIMRAIMRNGGI
ncbi:TPA: sugar ABC transporter ATP-binding protein [Burkholderia multivorans]|uniref:multiple monosaccharide ABC transporter ATP-binding protein n=1 Tax=Burkholderia multivorans TaxID=87883 RepID=UPI001C950ECC|nr:multiple monosaccharide ABC transporter ATP-binding protein [Burkholderia multivorans]MBY4670640.1 sugar ABC transporter ATP-binding protein [Burkholderia multivorans]MDN7747172.1 sugar ABC transporter ATP-binding protein [Burkholderia multivorans]HEM7808124.1 sugar ABC transporter ATP-binding protein [Burkholderia multivorans]HEM7814902.1 sugar ABC transporter ATP-binding protein [Burkholderia multivorans]HEM7820110.1 sugar ABC transporter ATP-binding protein [Burkholderia multivorans]